MFELTIDDIKRTDEGPVLLLTNDAVVRGALEADVKVISEYPGSPTSEILDAFSVLLEHFGDYKMEIAANEKIALETVAGASMAGVRSFTAMKSVGMNVASDTLFSLGYTGLNAGCVCLIADDPHAHSSQSEQDGRFFGEAAYIPMVEPSTAQEAHDMVKWAFEFSERYKTLVLMRTTTRVNHQRGMVRLDNLARTPFRKMKWGDVKAPYFTVGQIARDLKAKLLEKNEKIKEAVEGVEFNLVEEGSGPVGVLTGGISYLHTKEAMNNLGVKLPVFKVGTVYPLPEKKISRFIESLTTLIIVEELQPYFELRVTALAKDVNPKLKIIGKRSGHFSEMLEYNVPLVEKVLAETLGRSPSLDYDQILKTANTLKKDIPYRNPIFCAGCPHRGTLWAFRQALTRLRRRDTIVYNNDIGCYSMVMLKPNEFTDTMLCMGASVGLSAGMHLVLEDKVVAMVGDSTLYHAALPGIVNLIHHNANVTLFILDNSVTAMTGQQWNPNSPYDAGRRFARKINMEDFFQGLGADKITIVNPFETREAIKPIMDALEAPGFSVIISRGECALYGDRERKKRGEKIIPSENEKEICRKIYACIIEFHCPAILIDEADGKIDIMTDTCNGCLECQKVCPVNAPRHIERSANQEVAG